MLDEFGKEQWARAMQACNRADKEYKPNIKKPGTVEKLKKLTKEKK